MLIIFSQPKLFFAQPAISVQDWDFPPRDWRRV